MIFFIILVFTPFTREPRSTQTMHVKLFKTVPTLAAFELCSIALGCRTYRIIAHDGLADQLVALPFSPLPPFRIHGCSSVFHYIEASAEDVKYYGLKEMMTIAMKRSQFSRMKI